VGFEGLAWERERRTAMLTTTASEILSLLILSFNASFLSLETKS
jgi:hypothetical protein